jgi:hypothetical protein
LGDGGTGLATSTDGNPPSNDSIAPTISVSDADGWHTQPATLTLSAEVAGRNRTAP